MPFKLRIISLTDYSNYPEEVASVGFNIEPKAGAVYFANLYNVSMKKNVTANL